MNLPKKNEIVPLKKIIEICNYYSLDRALDNILRETPPLPFKSDGASMIPDSIGEVDLYSAAFLHDIKYWSGYQGQDNQRMQADLEFASDSMFMGGASPGLALALLTGVRIGGSSWLPTPWRWGSGRRR